MTGRMSHAAWSAVVLVGVSLAGCQSCSSCGNGGGWQRGPTARANPTPTQQPLYSQQAQMPQPNTLPPVAPASATSGGAPTGVMPATVPPVSLPTTQSMPPVGMPTNMPTPPRTTDLPSLPQEIPLPPPAPPSPPSP